MLQVVDNFLDPKYFNEIKKTIMSNTFPWYFNDTITDENDPKKFYYFVHIFYRDNFQNSEYYPMWKDFLKQIECKALLRIKGSMYVNNGEKRKNKTHVDYTFPHKGCLFYINENNGETYFQNKKVKPKENRAVFFDPHKPHSSSLCTDQKRRIVLNFNYF